MLESDTALDFSTASASSEEMLGHSNASAQAGVGDIVSPEQIISMPNGLFGFERYRNYVLLPMNDDPTNCFLWYQSIDELSMRFVVLPLLADAGVITQQDLEGACKVLEIEMENLMCLFLVNIKDQDDGLQVTVNQRAPILVDVSKQKSWQFVFDNPDYELQMMLMEREENA